MLNGPFCQLVKGYSDLCRTLLHQGKGSLWSLKKPDIEYTILAKSDDTRNKHAATDTKGTK